jgi:hypothetical protein
VVPAASTTGMTSSSRIEGRRRVMARRLKSP